MQECYVEVLQRDLTFDDVPPDDALGLIAETELGIGYSGRVHLFDKVSFGELRALDGLDEAAVKVLRQVWQLLLDARWQTLDQ
jgi:hypothetical protein